VEFAADERHLEHEPVDRGGQAMNLQAMNTICFAVSVVCIALGAMLAISMIWMDYSSQFLMKSWSTIGVVFLASTITLVVSKTFGAKAPSAP
jgi:succinate dehydrogenase hydrophobic anchor subunit